MKQHGPKMKHTINSDPATVIHIDLNSCFATIEAQANRLLRGHPVGVAAYDTPKGFVLAANYIAKSKGVKLGVNVAEAKILCPGIIIMTPDPSKYREAHKRFRKVLLEYTSDVVPKSIDEFVVNLKGSPALRSGLSMEQIGDQIKQQIYEQIGEAVTVNIGIGPNRFLAKYAAGFNKPNGMTRIDASNLLNMYEGQDLTDLPGINVRYKKRLQDWGVMNPIDFLAADQILLKKQVFKSIVGYHWYMRLRGYEVDDYKTVRRSIGSQYSLGKKTRNIDELERSLMKLCEKTGRRVRAAGCYGTGIHLYISFHTYRHTPDEPYVPSWHKGTKTPKRLYSTRDMYVAARALLQQADILTDVRLLAITVYGLEPCTPEQSALFEDERGLAANRRISDAVDEINNRYGEYVISPAKMMDMNGEVLDRIAFGNVRDLE